MAESTEGIVIRRIDYSETSLVVHFYTPDFGQVAALAKGAKRPRSAFQGGVDLLTCNQIVFVRRGPGGLATLTESAILDDYRGLRSDLNRLWRAEYVVELVASFTTEEDPNPALYEGLVEALEGLAAGTGDCVTQTVRFELALLGVVGYAPDWRHCVVCGRDLSPGEGAGFSVSEGGVVCGGCLGEARAPRREAGGTPRRAPAPGPRARGSMLAPGVLAAAAGLAEGGRRADRLRLTRRQVQPLGLALGRYITHLIGRPPRMLKYLEGAAEARRPDANRGHGRQ